MITVENQTPNDFDDNRSQKQNVQTDKIAGSVRYTKVAKEWLLTIIYAILFSVFIKSFLYENYKIPSGSMNPTLLTGDRILVNKFYYGYTKYSIPFGRFLSFENRILVGHKPQYGDVIVFAGSGANNGIFYIKRVIGLPGDKVRIENGEVIVNDKRLTYSFIGSVDQIHEENQNMFEVKQYIETAQNNKQYRIFVNDPNALMENTNTYTVPEGQYFCMGDNRDNSKDSRFLSDMGFIDFDRIVGKATVVMFSFSNRENFLKFNFKRLWKYIDAFDINV